MPVLATPDSENVGKPREPGLADQVMGLQHLYSALSTSGRRASMSAGSTSGSSISCTRSRRLATGIDELAGRHAEQRRELQLRLVTPALQIEQSAWSRLLISAFCERIRVSGTMPSACCAL